MKDIRENLKSLLDDRCCVYASIAKKAGLSPNQLSGILNKRRSLGSEELFTLCDALNITPSELRDYGAGQPNKSA